MKTWQWLIYPTCLVALACSGTSNTPTQSSSTSATCGQVCQDDAVGYAIDDTMWLIWNENFAGHPSGNQSLTASCPLSGSAQITGTTGVASNGINTIQLTFNLQNCGNSKTAEYSLTFTGPLTWDGSFGSSVGNALTFKSTALEIDGTVRLDDMPTVSESCAVSLTDTYNSNVSNQTSWLNGVICGRTVSQ